MNLTVNGTKVRTVTTNGVKTKTVTCNGVTVYRAAVTVTNLLNANVEDFQAFSDYGTHKGMKTIATYNVTAGHRYFVRGGLKDVFGYDYGSGGFYFNSSFRVGGTQLVAIDRTSEFTSTAATANIIFTPSSNWVNADIVYDNYMLSQGNITGVLEMLVDIAELESNLAYQLSADGFYNSYGKFFGSKEISL